jgi:hypothetical protein
VTKLAAGELRRADSPSRESVVAPSSGLLLIAAYRPNRAGVT